jgi:hypothetical protein
MPSSRQTSWLQLATCAALVALPFGPAVAEELDRAAQLEAAVATVTDQDIREHAGLLADDTFEGREAGKRGGRAAARYLEEQFKKAEIQPGGESGGYLQPFGQGYQNVIAVVPGVDPQLARECVIVGAHYDHVGYGTWRNSNGPTGYIHNGADDNASGVAALLELVDALHRTQWQPRRTIIIAFWDGEEINLLGSRHWVQHPTVPLESVKIAVNLDMLGRMKDGRLEAGGTRTAAGLRQMLSAHDLPEGTWLDFSWEFKENSDHWPFFAAGMPSLIFHTGVHPDYHTPRDDFEKLNVEGIRLASAYVLATVLRLADADEIPTFRPASRGENPSLQHVRQAPLPAAEPRLGLTWKWTAANAEGGAPSELRIENVTRGAAADAAGLRPGDVVAAVDGVVVDNEFLLAAAVLRAESSVTLSIARGDQPPVDLVVTLRGTPTQLGLSWREDDAEPGAVFVTRIVPHSPAARAGLRLNDRLYALDGQPLTTSDALLATVRERLAAGAESVQFDVETAGRLHTVDVDLRLPTADDGDASL